MLPNWSLVGRGQAAVRGVARHIAAVDVWIQAILMVDALGVVLEDQLSQ